ncbi:MAG: long-chain fatty acid--CoA ligase [Actinobacteria bacterium]|nr:MAG: long-chain fatty acid--CoA ligase [Actinomycetota bacterium]
MTTIADRPSTQTLADAFLSTVEARGDAPALLDADLTVALSWRGYGEQARRAAAGLRALGLRRGDTLGLLLSNRPEFHVADVGALLVGATPFSMYNTSSPEQLAHLVTDAGCRIAVTEAGLLPRLLAAREITGGLLEHVIVVDDGDDGLLRWPELLTGGDELTVDVAAGAAEDLATIIYTSGTTGPPKGVQLTHANVLAMVGDVRGLLGVAPEGRAISYLPMAHVAERTATHYLHMAVGFGVVCCPRPGDVADLLPRVRPDFFFSPPRLWEKLRAGVLARVSAEQLAESEQACVDTRWALGFDRLQAAITGAAPCPPAVIEFFHSIGVPLREVYGLSETTGLISFSRADDIRVGTVGPPVPSMEVRLGDDGEVLARGALVMGGYRNMPEQTAEMIDADGWLHTGDIGALDGDGHLRIVDRKKELIINASGKNMSPANIEARLKEASPLIDQACVIGDARPYNVALIVLDGEAAAALGEVSEEDRRAEVQRAVDAANAKLARVEQIKRFALLTEEWLPDSDELTPTMKLKRKPIAQKYAEQIEELYAEGRS